MLKDFVNPAQPSVALADLANVIRPIDENMKYKLRMVFNFDMMDSAGTRLGDPLLPDVLADFRFLCFESGRNRFSACRFSTKLWLPIFWRQKTLGLISFFYWNNWHRQFRMIRYQMTISAFWQDWKPICESQFNFQSTGGIVIKIG